MAAVKAGESPALLRELPRQMQSLLSRCLLFLSALSSHPLFSTFTAASLLAVLYLPRPLLALLLSPVPISFFILLTALFSLGSLPPNPPDAVPAVPAAVDDGDGLPLLHQGPKSDYEVEPVDRHQKLILFDAFLDWGRRPGPLEVIYEEYEGEGEEEEEEEGEVDVWLRWIQYADLDSGGVGRLGFSHADPEKESDSGSPDAVKAALWSFPESIRLLWEDEEEGDDMIEIELEEDNLIEIDVSGGR